MIVASVATVGWYRRHDPPGRGALATAGAAALLIAAAAALLLAMGRVPTYRHGPFRLYTSDVHGDENSQQLTDPYTFTHVTHGILLYAALHVVGGRAPIGLRVVTAVALEGLWEVVENTDAVIARYRAETIAQGYYGDSVVNSIGDMAATIVGFAIAASLPARATAALAVVLESVLLLWIRDNLALNVVMLLWPIDALRVWQQGG